MLKGWRVGRFALVTLVAAFIAVVAGCGDDKVTGPKNELSQYDAEVAAAWFDLFLDITKTEGITPPVASRAFAYEGVAFYESVVPGLETHQSLAGQLNGLTSVPQPGGNGYHWPTVANAALAEVARHLYGELTHATLQAIDDLEDSFEAEFAPEAGTAVFDRSVAHGRAVGEAIYNWAFDDGYSQYHNCGWTPPVGEGLWEPTPPAYAAALEPCWGDLRDYVLEQPTECGALPPYPYDENPQSPFYIEAKEVYDVGLNLTEGQRTIGLYWADGAGTITPPGHWVSILNQLNRDSDMSLDVACEAYAKLGVAVGQAFVTCWRTKFTYNLVRPVTCIQKVLDPSWSPLIATPPFPEHVSGHSSQSGAAAQVLTDMFGHMAFEDRTHEGLGFENRSFSSFFDAADEAAVSRLYGGIHYRNGNNSGLTSGICVGQKVSALQFER